MINIKEDERLSKLNHSGAHLLAQAVKHLYPNAKFWVGPVIEEGFYYDIDLGDEVLSDEDLEKIEREMKKIPYSIILGQKEVDAGNVSVRSYKDGDLGAISVEEFKAKILKEVKEKIK